MTSTLLNKIAKPKLTNINPCPQVLAVRCVYGSYPARLLDLWDLYDECKGSENDNPAILPADQQFIVLELANAGQDLESYQFNNAEQAYALFMQVWKMYLSFCCLFL